MHWIKVKYGREGNLEMYVDTVGWHVARGRSCSSEP